MVKLTRYIALEDGVVIPMGVTTTYRVVSDDTSHGVSAENGSPPPSALQQWRRRQHPADIIRIILMLIAVSAVLVTVVRAG